MYFDFFANSFYQRKIGLLEPDEAILLEDLLIFRSWPITRHLWSRLKRGYAPDFVAHVDAIILQQGAVPPWRDFDYQASVFPELFA